MGRTEQYVVGLLEKLLGPKDVRNRFEWAVGDVSPKTGRAARLPFDAAWEERKLIVEADEDQHTEATPFFDKPDRITASGVHRGLQRRMYDERKRRAARAQGYKVVEIEWSRKRKPKADDIDELRRLLVVEGVLDRGR